MTVTNIDSVKELFNNQGYAVIKTPVLSEEIIHSFDNMPRDGHSLKRLRTIRLSQYITYNEEGEWILGLLPKRKYIQSAKYIRLAEAGGVMRHREQIEIDPSILVNAVLNALPLSSTEFYHVNVNQIRVAVTPEFKGITVPEGAHRDGHDFSVIAVSNRYNVSGGETFVIDPITNEIIFRTLLKANEAILLDDVRYIHNATNIEAVEGSYGHRDIWVIEVNKWSNRAYGVKHERLASKG